MNKRHQIILELINNKKKISVNELSELTKVSLVTIRNDLSILEQQNYVKRTHGFAEILDRDSIQSKSESVIGPLTRSCINQTHFNKSFLGIDGYSPDIGFTGRDMMRAEVINTVLNKGAENFVISDSSKFGLVYPYSIDSNNFKQIITDNNISADMEKSLKNKGIIVHKV